MASYEARGEARHEDGRLERKFASITRRECDDADLCWRPPRGSRAAKP